MLNERNILKMNIHDDVERKIITALEENNYAQLKEVMHADKNLIKIAIMMCSASDNVEMLQNLFKDFNYLGLKKVITEPMQYGKYHVYTPFFMAAMNNNIRVLKFFAAKLEHAVVDFIMSPIKTGGSQGMTPFFVAGVRKSKEVLAYFISILDYLVNKAINQSLQEDAAQFAGCTPLYIIAKDNDIEIMKIVLTALGKEASQAITTPMQCGDSKGITPFFAALSTSADTKMVECLLDVLGNMAPSIINTPMGPGKFQGETPLSIVVRSGKLDVLQCLLKACGDPIVRKTAINAANLLSLAIDSNNFNLDLIKFLIAEGAMIARLSDEELAKINRDKQLTNTYKVYKKLGELSNFNDFYILLSQLQPGDLIANMTIGSKYNTLLHNLVIAYANPNWVHEQKAIELCIKQLIILGNTNILYEKNIDGKTAYQLAVDFNLASLQSLCATAEDLADLEKEPEVLLLYNLKKTSSKRHHEDCKALDTVYYSDASDDEEPRAKHSKSSVSN